MNKEKYYYQVEIGFTKKTYEDVLNILYRLGINQILETDNSFILYFTEAEREKETLLARCIFDNELIKNNLYDLKKIKNQDWDKNWKKSIKPVFIKDKIIVYPSWLKKSIEKFKKRILIEIDPKMSFGTGHNETTQLVLEQMCDFWEEKNKKILDFGCGTGVLAIAGLKLGAKKLIAIDTDKDSIDNAKEYFEINNVKNLIKLHRKTISELKESNFDVVLANILRNVIEENLTYIYKKLKINGKLFISGILNTEDELISKALINQGFNIIDKRYKAEWIGFYAIKK